LLIAVGYLREANDHLSAGVPVLRKNDKAMSDAMLELSRSIMAEWLHQNYPSMRKDLSGLSPMQNGLPFSLMFSEVWHYTFGFAAKSLAESGFYSNPRAPGSRYEGYMPLVWASSILKGPAN
jgi:hypothetical protein